MDKAGIEALKASRPILQVLQDLGVEVRNNRFRCPRPEGHAHGDRTPSVTVWPERGSFRCWVCADVRGDVIDLVRLVKGSSFREALDFLGAPPPPARGRRPDRNPSPPAADARPPSMAGEPFPGPEPGRAYDAAASARTEAAAPLIGPTGQTTLFASDRPPASSHAPSAPAAGAGPGTRDSVPGILSPSASAAATHSFFPSPSASDREDDQARRLAILAALIDLAVPVQGRVARYLQKRRIFKRTWDGQKLRMIDDYAGVSRALEAAFGRPALERAGFFNPAGHLRYYRHRLLFPYFDPAGRPVYLQARGIEDSVKPKELSMAGPIPLPYNVRLLDGVPGQIYLCEGIIDTLTLLEQGFPAVGVPGAANFKPAWAALFRNKSVHVAFDPDAPGENGAARAIELLHAEGVEARRLAPPTGLDLNDWFQRG